MKVHFKITGQLADDVRKDLRRPHGFAMERVGFILCKFGLAERGGLLILAHSYQAVEDEDYIDDHRYGAVINSNAFRKAMQCAYSDTVGLFHVHLHDHKGKPFPSVIDLRETNNFVPDFFHVRPNLPHGALILSADSISGRIWHRENRQPEDIGVFSIVGFPYRRVDEHTI